MSQVLFLHQLRPTIVWASPRSADVVRHTGGFSRGVPRAAHGESRYLLVLPRPVFQWPVEGVGLRVHKGHWSVIFSEYLWGSGCIG